MVHFFGILEPARRKRFASADAPRKASFFGGIPDAAQGAVPLSRAEQDACFLAGKAPEPSPSRRSDPRRDGLPER